ncbi:MAG: T9SS type A sorting domain-containing protein, partial [Flavobacterium sp.]|nr:T9SS type A sorting domain-containing protein [Flavobacterium sp.]
MKKHLLLIFIFTSLFASAQFTKSAPWMVDLVSKKSESLTIQEMNYSFNEYWKNHDKNLKGSGYKPFMRWDYHWQNLADNQGYIITPQELWTAFNQKNAFKNNKSRRAFSLPASDWQPVGPFTITGTGSWSTGQGRVSVVYVDPSNANTIYIGTPAGGIWKSTTAGTNWLPLADNLPQIGVSGIAVDPNNSDIIYIATGDADASDSYSIGVLKSIDGGTTWNTTGLAFNNTNSYAGDILINPNDSSMIWVGTTNGIYKSINGGTTFLLVQSGDFSQGRIRLKPNNPTIVYAVSKNRFFKSTNSGSNFSIVTNGMPSTSGRLIMDVTAANAEVLYILSSDSNSGFQGLYKSINSGVSFVKTANTADVFESNQSWYDLALAVSQTNENEIYTGCLNIWKSTNGGVSFVKRNSWNAPTSPKYTHADIHYLKFFGDKLYCGSDGGVFMSSNGSTSFTNLTASAQIGQFYKIAVSKQSASKMVGGLQDNGGHAYSDNQWKNYYGADGMDTAIDPNNSSKFYGFIQNGTSLYVSNNAGASNGGGIGSPNGASGNWVTPLKSNSIGEIYSGFSDLFKITNGAWVQVNTNPFGQGNIDLIAIDPSNDNIIYVVINASLFKSTDKGINFDLVYDAPANISSIAVHTTDSSIVYLTTKGTSGEALKSIDGGLTFLSINAGLPNIGKNVIVHQGRNSVNPLYLGTSLGVYYRDDSMSQWEPFDTNLPNVSINDLDINLEDKKITAATYGRGIWQSNIVLELAAVDIKIQQITSPSTVLIDCTNSVTPKITLKNDGLNTVNTITINYSINTNNYVYVWNSSLTANAVANIVLPAAILAKGVYVLTVECIAPNDNILSNNTASSNFFLNDSGTPNVVNTFENPADDLIAYDDSGFASTWKRGICTTGVVNSGSNNIYTTNLTGNYPDVRKSFLVSQCYNLTQMTNPLIKFKMAYDLEENWDLVYVEYSVNNGQVWYNLGQMGTNWYNSDRNPNTTGTDCTNCLGGQWTGSNTTLTEYSYDLFQLAGFNNIIFRIVFHSDDAVNGLGVVIDDFVIESAPLGLINYDLSKIGIYPNPSKNIFKVALGEVVPKFIEVYDIAGKVIISQKDFKIIGNETQLDLTNASSGIYFVKIA